MLEAAVVVLALVLAMLAVLTVRLYRQFAHGPALPAVRPHVPAP